MRPITTDYPAPPMKHFLQSKTIWLQVIAALSMFLPPMQAWLAANPEQPIAVLCALNVLLRFFTSGKVTLFTDDSAGGSGVDGKLPGWVLVLGMGGLAGLVGFSLPSCATTTTTSATGAVTKTVVPDTAFSAAIVDAATKAATEAIPAAVDAYVQTHQSKSAALAEKPSAP